MEQIEKIQKFVSENIEAILIGILVLVLVYLLWDRSERFSNGLNVKQCDFNDPNLSGKCKEIRDGCGVLKGSELKIENDLKKYCNPKAEGKTARETISSRRDCVTDVERVIRAKYAKSELCSQIKNMPGVSKDTKLNDLSLSSVQSNDLNHGYANVNF
jgi:hypothetical protein